MTALALCDRFPAPEMDLPLQGRRPQFSVYHGVDWRRRPSPGTIDSPEAFLRSYPHLAPLVEECKERLTEAFGTSTRVFLGLLSDTEDVSSPELIITASTLLDPDAAIAAMETLEDQWWFDQFERSEGRVHVAFQHRAG